jgi:hypothetical protein
VKHEARERSLLATFSPDDQRGILNARRYQGDETVIKRVNSKAGVNEDWKPLCEYYLGLP